MHFSWLDTEFTLFIKCTLKYFDYLLKWNDKKVVIRYAWWSLSYRLWYIYIYMI